MINQTEIATLVQNAALLLSSEVGHVSGPRARLAATEIPHVCESCDGSGYKLTITRGDVWQWESEEVPCPECNEITEEVPF